MGLPFKFYFTTNYSKDVSNNSLFSAENFAVINSLGNVLEDIPPRNRWNFSLGNGNLFKSGISLNISYRHQSPSSNFTSIVAKANQNQPFVPALNLFDAQISKKISSLKQLSNSAERILAEIFTEQRLAILILVRLIILL